MSLRSLAVVIVVAAACGDTPAPRVATNNAVRSAVRVRSMERYMSRPDTLLGRVDTARVLGAAAARVWVVFVGELQCAACTSGLQELVPMLRREYVETGKIRLAYVNAGAPDTDYNARFAAHSVYCAGIDGHFWDALGLIAARREEWAGLDDPQPRLDSIAVQAGANRGTQAMCRQRQRMLPMVMWDRERALSSDITELPTLLIDNQPLTGDLSPATVRRAIDKALSGAP